jgi:chemotaxis protein MotB
LKVLPNHLLIEGHTDAQPYSGDKGYSNWELSSDRANSARKLLQDAGVGINQISQVRGYADQSLRVPSNPLDPSNRRVSLIVQWADASDPAKAVATLGAAGGSSGNEPGNGTVKPQADGTAAPAVPAEPSGKSSAPPSQTTTATPQGAVLKPPLAAAKPTWSQKIEAMMPGKKKQS